MNHEQDDEEWPDDEIENDEITDAENLLIEGNKNKDCQAAILKYQECMDSESATGENLPEFGPQALKQIVLRYLELKEFKKA